MTTNSELIASFPTKAKANAAKIKAMKAGYTDVTITQEDEYWVVNGVTPVEEAEKPKADEKDAEPTLTIPELLKKLETATSQSEKKKLRRALRAQGHKGGMNKATKSE